jgi:DNA-directed RNA polymerase specialized sigma24 family protein
MALWAGIPGFRGDASERTWLYRIAHNTAAEQIHKLQRRRERERQPRDADPEPAHNSTPESDFHDPEVRRCPSSLLSSGSQPVPMSLTTLSPSTAGTSITIVKPPSLTR